MFVLNNSIIFAILANLRIAIHSHKLTYIVAAVAQTIFQCYRFLTTFLTPSGMFTDSPYLALLDIYGFYTFACDLESSLGKFKGNFPDCLWFTLITGTMIVISTFTFELFYPAHHSFHHLMMLSCVTYLWSRYLKNATKATFYRFSTCFSSSFLKVEEPLLTPSSAFWVAICTSASSQIRCHYTTSCLALIRNLSLETVEVIE